MNNKKIYSLKSLSKIIQDLKKKSKKIVHCHGVFDLLHVGHIKHLNKAREKGDKLVVTITPDKYINKGPGRPVFNQVLRSEALAAIDVVDYVAINETPTAVHPIKILKPNIYCKGKDYKNFEDDITGEIKNELKRSWNWSYWHRWHPQDCLGNRQNRQRSRRILG